MLCSKMHWRKHVWQWTILWELLIVVVLFHSVQSTRKSNRVDHSLEVTLGKVWQLSKISHCSLESCFKHERCRHGVLPHCPLTLVVVSSACESNLICEKAMAKQRRPKTMQRPTAFFLYKTRLNACKYMAAPHGHRNVEIPRLPRPAKNKQISTTFDKEITAETTRKAGTKTNLGSLLWGAEDLEGQLTHIALCAANMHFFGA